MKKLVLPAVVSVLAGAAYYYAFLPPMNIHSGEFWSFVILLLGIFAGLCVLTSIRVDANNTVYYSNGMQGGQLTLSGIGAKAATYVGIGIAVIIALLFVMQFLSGPIINAKAYAALGNNIIADGDFDTDVPLVEDGIITDIAIMDTLTAETLGSRQIGSLGTLATQYELGDFMTTTINGNITKVATLGYGDFFKWVNSRSSGIPGYVTVDPVLGTSAYVEFDTAIVYSDTGYFMDNAYRQMRFSYPLAMFYNMHFEVDNAGNPYWVASVQKINIGLFGGSTPNGVIVMDAVTGECTQYATDEIPDWVSIAYPAGDLIRLVNYAGEYSNGFLNSILAKKDVYVCTDDYGYKVVSDELNAFTGVTSAASDQSNMAFVLCNEYTGQIIRYTIYGAEEYSAMTAAEGLVLDFGYEASFPSICNVEGAPVYIMALTDAGNLIKKYAMVDLQDYTKVVIGDTVQETWENFLVKYTDVQLVPEVDDTMVEETPAPETVPEAFAAYDMELNGLQIAPVLASVDGNSYIYLYSLEGEVYRVPLDGNEAILLYVVNPDYAVTCYALTVTNAISDGVYAADFNEATLLSGVSQ